jgi:hypothetical protein
LVLCELKVIHVALADDCVLDACGVCNGDNSTCCHDYLGVENALWDFVLLPVAVDEMIEKLQNLHAVLTWVSGELPHLEGGERNLPVHVGEEKVGTVAEINQLFLRECGLLRFCQLSGQFLESLREVTLPA